MFDDGPTQISNNSVRIIADTIGVNNLSEPAASAIANDATFRLKDLIQSAKKFSEKGRTTALKTSDIDCALRLRGIEPLYGFCAPDFIPFRVASGGGRELYFTEEKECDLSSVINTAVPKVPLQVTLKSHWLAIDGAQPAIPENPVATQVGEDKKESVAEPSSSLGKRLSSAELVNLKETVTHQISVEHQLYFKEITEACVGSDEKRRSEALQSLATDTGLQAVLPRFAVFITEGIKLNVVQNNLALLIYLMRMIKSLVDNSAVNLERVLHEFVPLMLSCILSRKLCSRDQENHWALRDFASRVLSHMCKSYLETIPDLQARVCETLTNVLDNNMAAVTTIYGALSAFNEMGSEVVHLFVVPRCPYLGDRLRTAIAKPGNDEIKEAAERAKSILLKMLIQYYKTVMLTTSDGDLSVELGTFIGPQVFQTVQSRMSGYATSTPISSATMSHRPPASQLTSNTQVRQPVSSIQGSSRLVPVSSTLGVTPTGVTSQAPQRVVYVSRDLQGSRGASGSPISRPPYGVAGASAYAGDDRSNTPVSGAGNQVLVVKISSRSNSPASASAADSPASVIFDPM